MRESIVTVMSATTQTPSACPVSAERPLGTSTATTRAGHAFTHSIQMSNGGRTSPWKPVPSMQSSTTSAVARRASSSSRVGATITETPARTALWATWRARSPESASGSIGLTTVTLMPFPWSASAATQPSPPLLPSPTSATTFSAAPSSRDSRAAASPARRMSSATLTPSRVSATSTRLTSSMFSTGCIVLPLL